MLTSEPQVSQTVRLGDRSESIWSIATQVYAIAGHSATEAMDMVESDGGLTEQEQMAFARAFDVLEQGEKGVR